MAPMIDSADHVTRMLPVNGPMFLSFVSGRQRLAVELKQDLLGDWVVLQTTTGGARSTSKTVLVPSVEEGFEMMQAISARQQKRGYRLLQPLVPGLLS